jgi:hypothetical protein
MISGGREKKQFKILIRKYFKIRFTWKVEKSRDSYNRDGF